MDTHIKVNCPKCSLNWNSWKRTDGTCLRDQCPRCRKGLPPDHGKPSTYQRGCRCRPCSAAYSDKLRGKHPDRSISTICTGCGESFGRSRNANAELCTRCRHAPQREQRRAAARAKLERAAAGPSTPSWMVFVGGNCHCGQAVVKQIHRQSDGRTAMGKKCHSCCSEACHTAHRATSKKQHGGRHRSRARFYGVPYEPVKRLDIFERDEYVCGLCHQPVSRTLKYPDPMSPSLDHIVPMSRGGAHSYDNVQCSHLCCNVQASSKRNEYELAQ